MWGLHFPKSKCICIKAGSDIDYFFEYKKAENNFKQKLFFIRDIQIDRDTYSRMREKKMIKYPISTVNVQQLFVVVYDEKAF